MCIRDRIKTEEQVPLIDVGTVKLIKSGALPLYPGLERFTPGGVVFSDGRACDFDAVVLATGYRPDVGELIPQAGEAIAPGGVPVASGCELGLPGLYACGFYVSRTGMPVSHTHLDVYKRQLGGLGVLVGVLPVASVGVAVGVSVGVPVAVAVRVAVAVAVGVTVIVAVGGGVPGAPAPPKTAGPKAR